MEREPFRRASERRLAAAAEKSSVLAPLMNTPAIPALATRKPGDPHPYVIGKDAVQRYMTVVDECAQAGLARVKG